ncbi:MAG: type III-A CRISPR-associated RAMP protein Csm3 [Coprothermobacterota bacterium]|nr:type III-A CRISPR-associated RAMP protein Csm3 [Coprothermobacterota bacterium]
MKRLERYIVITGVIHCQTGLRIGGTKEGIEIGGQDNPILRHPITNIPYIPGSSLKGKLRSLLEQKHCTERLRGGEPCGCGQEDCLVCRIFGPHKNTRHSLGPTRLLVRDASLTPESEAWLRSAWEEKGIDFSEIKTEVTVNRSTGIAADKGLRTQERVPAGAKFDFEVSFRVFEGDNEKQLVDFFMEGLNLLQADYLGGSGSRGYGKVKIENLKRTIVKDRPAEENAEKNSQG